MNTSSIDRYTLKQYTRLIISFFGVLLLLSIYQYTTLYFKGVVDTILSGSFFIALTHQLGYASLVGLILVFPFNFWENLRPKYGFNLVFVIIGFLIIIEAALTSYYCTALVPLGADLIGYSFKDIKMTISNSGGISFLPILGLLVILGVYFGLYKVTSKYYHYIARMYPFTIILFSFFISTLYLEGKPINLNKTQYLVTNIYSSTTEDTTYKSDEEFPMIKEQRIPDVLGDYFALKEEKPNIVFLIVEGLGRDFVGDGAEYGGYTPFLDSLSQKSLYWKNCLANTGRTFGVLPSLTGSLPFGKSGFMELEEYPNKLTLFSILKNNGYRTSFYQGTNGSFDNVDKFLISEDVDFILDKSGFGADYEMQKGNDGGFTWGFPDKELFKKSLTLDRTGEEPRFEVYMTISNHEPFMPPRQDYYEDKVSELLKTNNHSQRVENVVKKNDNIFATLLYTDDAIKYAIEGFKKQPGFENTIFVITGDHRLVPIPMRNSICRFNVPLIIYSPMLKTPRAMSGITSHFDVTPTMLSLLEAKYEMKMPKKAAWMGDALDTNIEFRGVKEIPLMRNKNDLREYVSKDKLLSDGKVYNIDENLDLVSSFGGGNIEERLKGFKSMNTYVTTNDKIIPDSLAIFTVKKDKFTEKELVWFNSLYNGYNSDVFFIIARDLAFEKKYDKSLLLCRYILSERPRHTDTKILMGRINAWRGNSEVSIKLLKECIEINPDYIDSYSALFDVYFWNGHKKEALELVELVKKNSSSVNEIEDKISRAKREAQKAGIRLSVVKEKKKETKIAALEFSDED